MSNHTNNYMKVYGSRKNLDVFKSDMACDCENGIISFQNVIPAPQNASPLEDEIPSGSESWKCLNWGCPSDALWPKVIDKHEHLSYTFGTTWGEPIPIYELLMDRYNALNFEIDIIFEITDNWVELASKRGELLKKSYMYWQCIPWRDGKYKDMLYRKDLLKDTLQVVEERIFHPEEYDEANHKRVKKDTQLNDRAKTESVPAAAFATKDRIVSEKSKVLSGEINNDDLLREIDDSDLLEELTTCNN